MFLAWLTLTRLPHLSHGAGDKGPRTLGDASLACGFKVMWARKPQRI
jgi:hypothetical protein